MKKRKDELLSRFSGEYCCRNDESLTLIGETAGFSGLFGCTKEELKSVYNNSLLELIVPEFRDTFLMELKAQLEQGSDVEVWFPVKKKDGALIWLLNRGYLYEDEDGQETLCGVLVDVTRLKHRFDAEKLATSVLREQAEKDSLTKIYNARTARKLAEKYLAEEAWEPGCVLLIIDLDNFKKINDRYGHMFGDIVLVQAARTIRKLFRSEDIVGRIGGEEFMVLMKDVTDTEIVNRRCNQLNEAFRELLREQVDRPLSCSIGAAFGPAHGKTYFELFCNADQALYSAKGQGKDQYVFFDPEKIGERDNRYAHKFADYDAEAFRGYIDLD